MDIQVLKREFTFSKNEVSKTLPDPNPQWTPTKVKEHYIQAHPELINSYVGEPKISKDTITYEFVIQAGTKG